jgi:hypothetical protein
VESEQTPVILIAKGVITEDLSALLDQQFTAPADRRVDCRDGLLVFLLSIECHNNNYS